MSDISQDDGLVDSNFFDTRSILPKKYEGFSSPIYVEFTSDAWVDATAIAQASGKRFNDWSCQKATHDYIQALIEEHYERSVENRSDLSENRSDPLRVSTLTESDFIKTYVGGTGGGRAWIHPDLVIRYASWINPRFAIWCDRMVKAILAGRLSNKENPSPSISDLKTSIEAVVTPLYQKIGTLESSFQPLLQKIDILESFISSLVSNPSQGTLLLTSSDQSTSTFIKEVSNNRRFWHGAEAYADFIGLSPRGYINLVFCALGFLVMTADGWVVTPRGVGYLDIVPKPLGSKSKAKNTVIYHVLAATLLYGLNIIFSGRTPIITKLTEDEMSNLPGDKKFTQNKPTITSILSVAVSTNGVAVASMADTSKTLADTNKVNADNAVTMLEIIKRLTPQSAKENNLLPIEDVTESDLPVDSLSSNVLPFSKAS